MASPAASTPVRASLLHNITWLTAGSVLVKPLWFVFITAFCMRVLGTAGYGTMNAALALVAMAALFSDLGTHEFTIREVSRNQTEASRFFSNLSLAKTLLGLLSALAAIGAAWVLGYRQGEMLTVAAAGFYVMARGLTEYCRAFYRAYEILRYEAISVVLEKVLVIGGGILLLFATRTPQGTLAGMAVGMTVTLLLNIIWVHRKLSPWTTRVVNPQFILQTFRNAFPLGLMAVFTIIFLSSGTVLLEAMQGQVAAGQYGAAYRIVEALLLLPAIVATPVLPRLSHLHQCQDMLAFKRILSRALLVSSAAALGISLVLSVTAPHLIYLLDPSPDFAQSGRLLRSLAWAFPLMTASNLLGAALIALDQQHFLAITLGLSTGILILLNLILIPVYSYYAPVIALLISQALVLGGYGWRYTRMIQRPTF